MLRLIFLENGTSCSLELSTTIHNLKTQWRILEVPTMQMPFIKALKLKKTERYRKHQSHCSQHLGSHRGPTRWALHHLHVGLSHCRIKLWRWYTLSRLAKLPRSPQISPNSTNITSCVGHDHGKTMENMSYGTPCPTILIASCHASPLARSCNCSSVPS